MKILFVHNALRSFVRVDRDILASQHDVDELDLSVPLRIATLPVRLLQADLLFAWFASLHSLLPVLGAAALRKPSIVVVGGYDTANVPAIGYGHMGHPWKRHVVRRICNTATTLIASSQTAAVEVHANTHTEAPIHALYQGFLPRGDQMRAAREPLVLTVGNVNRETLQRKGLEVFIQAAGLVPEARFMVVGKAYDHAADYLRSIAPPNAQVVGYMNQAALDELMMKANVYVQASAHESFGCSLVEAMLSGCMPVVSRRGALPEVAGEDAIFVDGTSHDDVARGVRLALGASTEVREAIVRQASARFHLSRRKQRLLQLVEQTSPGRSVAQRAPGVS
jgi:glycosyltransferase involved in cell wall biosynthesis